MKVVINSGIGGFELGQKAFQRLIELGMTLTELDEKCGPVKPKEMYSVYNMGIGMCVVLPKGEVEDAIQIAERYNVECYKIGNTFRDTEKKVILKEERLVSKDDRFDMF